MTPQVSRWLKAAAWFQAIVALMNILFVIVRVIGGVEWLALAASFSINLALLLASLGVGRGYKGHILLSGLVAALVLFLYGPFYTHQALLLLADHPIFKEALGILITLSIGAGLTVLPASILVGYYLIYAILNTLKVKR